MKYQHVSSFFCTFAAGMRYKVGYNREGEYEHYTVSEPLPLLEWLMANVQQSKSKIKATLQGRGIKVNGKTVSQFDFPLERGMKIAVSKTKRNQQGFKSRYVKIVYDRRYVAVCSGEMEQDDGTIANWLKDNKAFVTYSSPVDNGGKYAVTHYHVLDRTPELSLVEFRLETGRKNQIRVHASDMGHPVCGDVKYGKGVDPVHRLCLHAWLLCFTHPVTGEPMEFETPIPTVFRKLFK